LDKRRWERGSLRFGGAEEGLKQDMSSRSGLQNICSPTPRLLRVYLIPASQVSAQRQMKIPNKYENY
jgi:hypothetical protein